MSEGPRERGLRAALAADGLDAVVCRLPANVLLLTGYWPMNGVSFAWLPASGAPVLIAPQGERDWAAAGRWADVRTFGMGGVADGDPLAAVAAHLRDALAPRAGARVRLGYEGSFETVAPPFVAGEGVSVARPTLAMLAALPGVELADATDLLEDQRAIKTANEIAGVRRAVAVADLGCAAFRAALRPGARECDVVAAVETAVITQGTGYQGASRARGWATVLSGAASDVAGRPFQVASTRAAQDGETAILELGVVVDGFWADLTRTCAVGQPSARQRAIHAAALAAHDAAFAVLRPGVTGAAADHAARASIAAASYGAYFPHQTGHGLGFRYHESRPLLHPAYTGTLAAGMVVTVEPGIYLPGEFGMRIEDDVLITADGAEYLSQAERGL
ncbi:MAG TPA: Xaa-Pro peptidase family protein [Ktedonobacterales bacterium]